MTEHKVCTTCGVDKELELFCTSKRIKSGYTSECKDCATLRLANYYKNNKGRFAYNPNRPESQKEKKRITDKAYRKRHPEKIKEKNKRNIGKKRESGRAYYHNNKVKMAEYAKKYRQEHKIWHCTRQHQRRAKIKANGGAFSEGEWGRLLSDYNYTCLKCGRGDVPLTIDHIIPITLNGDNSINNVQPLCRPCNSSKGVKIIDYRREDDYRRDKRV